MFQAKTKDGRIFNSLDVETREEWEQISSIARDGNLVLMCKCGARAVPVSRQAGYGRGAWIARFFRHPPRATETKHCPIGAGESRLHSTLKAAAMHVARARGLEAWLEQVGDGYVADVLILDRAADRTYCIEIQLSAQIPTDTLERTRRRRADGVIPIWFFERKINVVELPDDVHQDPVFLLQEPTWQGKVAEVCAALDGLLDGNFTHMTPDHLRHAPGAIIIARIPCAGCSTTYLGTFGIVVDLSRKRGDWEPASPDERWLNSQSSWIAELLARTGEVAAVRWSQVEFGDAGHIAGEGSPHRAEYPHWINLACPGCGLAHPQIGMKPATMMKAPPTERIPIRFPVSVLTNPLDLLSGWRQKPRPLQPPVSKERWQAIAAARLTEHRKLVSSCSEFRKVRAIARRSELKVLQSALKPCLPAEFDLVAWSREPRFEARGREMSFREAIYDLPDDAWGRIARKLHAIVHMLTLEGTPEIELLGFPIEEAQIESRRLWGRKQTILSIQGRIQRYSRYLEPRWSETIHPGLGRAPIDLIRESSDAEFDRIVGDLNSEADIIVRRRLNLSTIKRELRLENEEAVAQTLSELEWEPSLEALFTMDPDPLKQEIDKILAARIIHRQRKEMSERQSRLASAIDDLRVAAARKFGLPEIASFWLGRRNSKLRDMTPEQAILRGGLDPSHVMQVLASDSARSKDPAQLFYRLVAETSGHYGNDSKAVMALERTDPKLSLKPKDVAVTEIGLEWVISQLTQHKQRRRR